MPDSRFVLDEASFDFSGFDSNAITESLQELADELFFLRSSGQTPSVLSGWGSITCAQGKDLATLLTDDQIVPGHLGARLLRLLDKCLAWDESPTHVVDPLVTISGKLLESYGIAWVVQQQHSGHATAVVSLNHRPFRGELSVTNQGSASNVHFVVGPKDHPGFFRSIYSVETVPESEFFAIGGLAFPKLDFAKGLSFGRFDGTYTNLKMSVVAHLSALHDHFLVASQLENQQSQAISTRIGINVSTESPNTRNSSTKMSLRDAWFDETKFRCEWHSKIEPHRNRIHFCPIGGSSDRIVIGIFVDHLLT